jgi:Ca-activated chloride channel family protein
MAGAKLAVAKRCAAWLVERLRGDDHVSLVAYDDQVRLLAPLAPVSGSRLAHAITSLRPGGSTNLSGGWLKGLEQLRDGPGDGPRKILLLTDGLANVGVRDVPSLVGLASAARDAGVGTTTIGFGHDFHEELLAAMADAGGGTYHYAATPDEAPSIFAAELEGLTSVAAQNVSLEIRPRTQVEMVGVLNEFPSVAVQGGVQVQLPDAYGGERRRVVFRLHVPRLGELGAVPVADLVLRYVAVGDEIAAHEVTIPVVVNAVSAAEAAAAEPDAEVREEVLVLRAAKAREDAIRLADEGDHDAAQLLLRSVADDLRDSGLATEAAELDAAAPTLAPASYSPASRKALHFEASMRKRRRRPRTPSSGPGEAA